MNAHRNPRSQSHWPSLLAGTNFRAERRIGKGGMGQIYESACLRTGEVVVVKLLRAELVGQPEMVDRMRLEGEVLAALRHPNIVRWRAHGITAAGVPYIAMERVRGRSLYHELRRRAALPLGEAVCHTRQLLSALQQVHAAGVVHRDIKPGNILVVSERSARTQIKLLDFGVAKVVLDGAGVRPLTLPTQDGACVGTPRYVAPEQILGLHPDARTDLYAVGILLYRLLAGRGPFDHLCGVGALMRAHLDVPPPPLSRFMVTPVPQGLEAIVARALAKHPRDRFEDASSFSRELGAFMSHLRRRGPLRLPKSGAVQGLCDPDPSPASEELVGAHLATTVVRKRFDQITTAVHAVRGGQRTGSRRTPHAGASERRLKADREHRPARSCEHARPVRGRRRPPPAPAALSRTGVALSAAAFAAMASGVLMWLVR